MNAPRLIGNLTALVAAAIVIAVGVDFLLVWMGQPPAVFCWAILPITTWAMLATLWLTFIGLVWWLISQFRSRPAAWLFLGGLGISLVPIVLPHYLGASC